MPLSSHSMNLWQSLPKPFSVLAPMEDVTDSPFRRLIVECGAPDVLFTEFTSVEAICSDGFEGVKHRLHFTPVERPLIAQIWGNTPKHYYETAGILADMGFAGIDINMGCPVPKVTKKGCCSALIENPNLAKELYCAAVEGAQGLPVSIKTRLGFKKDDSLPWADFLLNLQPAALTFHGRIAKHMSKYPANWNAIGEIVSLRNAMNSQTVLIGNGDVLSFDDILEKHRTFGVDGVMVGRGIFKNPYLFNSSLPSDFMAVASARKKLALLLRHAELFHSTWGSRKPYVVLKKYFKIYISNFAGASELRATLMETKDYVELSTEIEQWLQRQNAHDSSTINTC